MPAIAESDTVNKSNLFRKKGRPMLEVNSIEFTEIDEITELVPALQDHVNDLNVFIDNEITLDKHHIYPMYIC